MLRWRFPNLSFGFRLQGRKELRGHHLGGALDHSLTNARYRPTELQIAGVFYECAFAQLPRFWSAVTVHRFGQPQPVAAIG